MTSSTTWMKCKNGGWWKITAFYDGSLYRGTIQTWHKEKK